MKLSCVVKRYLAVPFMYEQYFSHADKSLLVVGLVPQNPNMKVSVAATAPNLCMTVNPGALVIIPLDRSKTEFRVRGIAL